MMATIPLYFTVAAMLTSLLLLPLSAFADQAQKANDATAEASAKASETWVKLLDNGKYGESWDDSATLMKLTIPKDEWINVLNKTRKPLGMVNSREVIDQRVANDPQGLPKGEYIVMFYKTTFGHKSMAYELVTLMIEDGKWRVLTYHVN
jgi:hypothetical protein